VPQEQLQLLQGDQGPLTAAQPDELHTARWHLLWHIIDPCRVSIVADSNSFCTCCSRGRVLYACW
jgi:hypothetical protein